MMPAGRCAGTIDTEATTDIHQLGGFTSVFHPFIAVALALTRYPAAHGTSPKGLEIVELTPRVIDLATRLRASHGLRTPDAIQAACALSLRGRTMFMTGDASFRKVEGLEVLIV